MKRALLRSFALLLVSVSLIAGALGYYLDTIIKNAIERIGPTLTGTPVIVGRVRTSLWRGQLKLYRFRVRNPKGFRIQNAFMADLILIRIRWTSLLTDTIEIEEIYVKNPTVVYEGLLLRNNLRKIRKNIERSGKPSRKSKKSRKSKRTRREPKYRIGRFRVHDGEIVVGTRLLGKKKGLTFALPEIDKRDVGGGEEGTSLKDVAAEMASSVAKTATAAVRKNTARGGPEKALETLKGLLGTK